jgi:hypothetical protein
MDAMLGEVYGMHGREEKCIQSSGKKIWRDYWDDLHVDGKIMLKMDAKETG